MEARRACGNERAKTMKHSLILTGGRNHYYVAGKCTCGNFNEFLNMVTRRGDVRGNKDFIKSQFKAHKAAA
jgi:hypothetical protein